MKTLEQHACFGGTVTVYEHDSSALGCPMTFSVFLPPQATNAPVPCLTFLAGLTCTHENFTTKAGAYRFAAELGLAIVAPDTSPRGSQIADADSYDFGQGAGFYLDATQAPWRDHYQMETYITQELATLVAEQLPVNPEQQGVCGHSMGGHGALTLYLKHPDLYRSVSAFAPIVAPSQVPWGKKAFSGYLGEDQSQWLRHDACALMESAGNRDSSPPILIDQGEADSFLAEQLKPDLFAAACQAAGQPLQLRRHAGYDHSYYFIQSFVEDHLRHHHAILSQLT